MSALRGKPDSLCSPRAFPSLTHSSLNRTASAQKQRRPLHDPPLPGPCEKLLGVPTGVTSAAPNQRHSGLRMRSIAPWPRAILWYKCDSFAWGRVMSGSSRQEVQRRLSADDRSISQWIGPIGFAVVVGIAYFLSAQLSLFLLSESDGVAVFWPAAGIASGALIVFGGDARLSVAAATIVATIVANLLGDRTIWAASAKALCNAGEALLIAGLIERYFGPRFDLDRLSHVVGFLAAAIVATAIMAVGGMAAIKLFHSPTARILTTWYDWFASDLLGVLAVAPLIIGLASAARKPPPRSELIEGIAALAVLAATTGIIVSLPPEPWKTVVSIAVL